MDRTWVSYIAGRFFTAEPPWKPKSSLYILFVSSQKDLNTNILAALHIIVRRAGAKARATVSVRLGLGLGLGLRSVLGLGLGLGLRLGLVLVLGLG